MWIFTRYGFFSGVSARIGKGIGGKIDPEKIMVRARVKQHLLNLKARFPEQLKATKIQTSKDTDYAYRIFVSRKAWSDVLFYLGAETNYDNFKSEVSRHRATESDYIHALHQVWSTMHRLQIEEKQTPIKYPEC